MGARRCGVVPLPPPHPRNDLVPPRARVFGDTGVPVPVRDLVRASERPPHIVNKATGTPMTNPYIPPAGGGGYKYEYYQSTITTGSKYYGAAVVRYVRRVLIVRVCSSIT